MNMHIPSCLILSCFATIVPGAFAQVPTAVPPPVPQNVLPGGGIAAFGKGDEARLYVVCGSEVGTSTPMYRYDRASRTWSTEDPVPMAMPAGSFLTSQPDNQHLYTTQGSSMHVNFFGTEVFRVWGYDPANVTIPKWRLGAGVCDPHYGPSLPSAAVYSSAGRDTLYVLCGGAPGIPLAFIQYSPDNNGGGGPYGKASFPPGISAGTTLASPWPSNGFLYATQGNGSQGFWKYEIRYDRWTQVKNVPEAVGAGAGLSSAPGGALICVTGSANPTEASPGFYRYDPVADGWSLLAPVPGQASGGGVAWVPNTDEAFVLKGGGSPTIWQYSFMDNAFAPRPAPPTQLVQRDAATGDEIPLLGSTPNPAVTFEGGPISPEAAPVALEVEVQPEGAVFTGTPTVRGPYVALEGAAASATVTGLTAPATYRWRARFRAQAGQVSSWKNFSGGNGDFRRKDNEAPTGGPVSAVRAWDGSAISAGMSLNDIDGEIRFEGSATDPDLNSVRLQIRTRLLGSAWPASAAESAAVPSGQAASCTFALSPGDYEWDYRFVDSYGAASAWNSETAGSSPSTFTIRRNGSTGSGMCSGSSAGATGSMGAVAALLAAYVFLPRRRKAASFPALTP